MEAIDLNNLRQVSIPENTETIINIDYSNRKIFIYSNRATVNKRLLRKGYRPTEIYKYKDEIEGMSFNFDSKELGKFLRTGLFKFD